MLHAGLVAEVQALRQQPHLHADLPSMRCVGYRQTWESLDLAERVATGPSAGLADDGQAPDASALLSEQAIALLREKGIAASRQLAKRQLTWLRSMPDRHVIACDQDDVLAAALDVIRQLRD
jgi:tRNA dimethylallyltransferase